MNNTPPVKIYTPFASSATAGYITAVPQTTSTPGAFSWTVGSGPETFLAPGSGGTPPLGNYFNGLMNQISDNIRYSTAGCIFVYDATYQTNIGGYPQNCILMMASGLGLWRSTVNNNMVNPETGTPAAPATGWSVLSPNTYPWSSITGAPTFTLESEFTGSNHSLVTNGYQKFPGGLMEQWMDVAVTGALNTTVNVTFPIAFPASPGVVFTPLVTVIDTHVAGNAQNGLISGLSAPPTLTGCNVYLGANGGGSRNVTLHVEVKGRWQ